jgi:hypothetical protein
LCSILKLNKLFFPNFPVAENTLAGAQRYEMVSCSCFA